MEIRTYHESDWPGLRACIVALQAYEQRWDDRLADGEEIADAYGENLFETNAETKGCVFVAEIDDQIAGFIAIQAEIDQDGLEEVPYTFALVSDLVILESYRGQGLGRALLARAEDYAREQGAQWLRIGVLAKNQGAQRLYEAVGYVPREIMLEKSV